MIFHYFKHAHNICLTRGNAASRLFINNLRRLHSNRFSNVSLLFLFENCVSKKPIETKTTTAQVFHRILSCVSVHSLNAYINRTRFELHFFFFFCVYLWNRSTTVVRYGFVITINYWLLYRSIISQIMIFVTFTDFRVKLINLIKSI